MSARVDASQSERLNADEERILRSGNHLSPSGLLLALSAGHASVLKHPPMQNGFV